MLSTNLIGPRVEEWRAELLNENDQLKRDLHEFTGIGTLENNMFNVIRGGGSIQVKGLDLSNSDIDWGRDRIKIWWDCNGESYPFGVYLIEAPITENDDENLTELIDITISDKLSIPNDDLLTEAFSLPAGSNIIDTVSGIMIALGQTKFVMTPSSEVTRIDQTFTPSGGGEDEQPMNWLSVINELLRQANYSTLYCDVNGQFRGEPYVDPARREPEYVLEYGEDSIHLPIWTREQNWYEIPNRVILRSQGTGDSEGLIAVAENLDANSPYSYPARGNRWISICEDREASSQTVLNQMARDRLGAAQYRVVNLQVTHATIPVWTTEAIRFTTPGYSGLVTVSNWSVNMGVGSLMDATWREVIRYG